MPKSELARLAFGELDVNEVAERVSNNKWHFPVARAAKMVVVTYLSNSSTQKFNVRRTFRRMMETCAAPPPLIFSSAVAVVNA
jgi:hypothetical protein